MSDAHTTCLILRITTEFGDDDSPAERDEKVRNNVRSVLDHAHASGILSDVEPFAVTDYDVRLASGVPSAALAYLINNVVPGTTPCEWSSADGPRSGVGEDYYFEHEFHGTWWVNDDQGHLKAVEWSAEHGASGD